MTRLTRGQWSQLKDAILCAKFNVENPSREYENLPDEVQRHEVGILIKSYLSSGKGEDLTSAAKLLAPDTKNYWVALERA